MKFTWGQSGIGVRWPPHITLFLLSCCLVLLYFVLYKRLCVPQICGKIWLDSTLDLGATNPKASLHSMAELDEISHVQGKKRGVQGVHM